MTGEPFVNQLRTRGDMIELASPGGPAITVRVEMPEVWDVVRVHASPDERVLTAQAARARGAARPAASCHEEYVLKLHGWEVLDEEAHAGRDWRGGRVDIPVDASAEAGGSLVFQLPLPVLRTTYRVPGLAYHLPECGASSLP